MTFVKSSYTVFTRIEYYFILILFLITNFMSDILSNGYLNNAQCFGKLKRIFDLTDLLNAGLKNNLNLV